MTPAIRRATLDDAPAIAAVHVASWEGAYRGLVPDAWFDERPLERRIENWRGVLQAPERARVWVAETAATDARAARSATASETVIGLGSANLPSRDADPTDTTAEISALYVHPDHWRAGAGRTLMATMLTKLAGGGFVTATLWVLEDNPRARAFYATAGFGADGATMRRPDGPPEIRLRRSLASPAPPSSPRAT